MIWAPPNIIKYGTSSLTNLFLYHDIISNIGKSLLESSEKYNPTPEMKKKTNTPICPALNNEFKPNGKNTP